MESELLSDVRKGGEMGMTDLISRAAALRCIKQSRENIDWGQSDDGDAFLHYTGALYRTMASSDCVPSVEAVPVLHGRWIDECCSECGQYVYRGDSRNYCPNCGAKMDGERRDSERRDSDGMDA